MKVKEKHEIKLIDPSGISAFSRCPYKYYLSRLRGIQNPNRGMIALDYGTDIHEAIPYCYEDVNKAIDIFNYRWSQRSYGFSDNKRNPEVAKKLLLNFAEDVKNFPRYKVLDPKITVPGLDHVSKNEVPYLIDIGADLPLAGRIDEVVEWNADGAIFAADFKTAGEISNRFFKNFENAPQTLAYTLAASQIYETLARGMLVIALRVSEKNQEVVTHPVFCSKYQLEVFIEFAKRIAEQILECNEKQEWPRNLTGCSPYNMFGSPGYLCDYYDICRNPKPENVIQMYNQTKPFNPFDI